MKLQRVLFSTNSERLRRYFFWNTFFQFFTWLIIILKREIVIIATKQVSILVTHDNTSLGNTCLCSYNITADCRDNQLMQIQSGFDERIFVFTQLLHNRCGIARRFLRMRTIAASCMAGGDGRYGWCKSTYSASMARWNWILNTRPCLDCVSCLDS